MQVAVVTGSAGLIGSEATRFFAAKGYQVVGIDNDMRKYFFGEEASTNWNNNRLKEELGDKYLPHSADIRDQEAIEKIFATYTPDVVVHAAGQPSHDWAAREPLTDFDVNARGTLIMLEATRKFAPKATFIFTSTNKVYGDHPNELPLVELETRFELPREHEWYTGIPETTSIDQTTRSIFGISKTAADVAVQEYGRYFGMNTAVFRGGCLTGPAHSGAPLHGFLAYLVRAIATDTPYTIHGYKGKQVRDNIHSYDLVNMFWHYHQTPRPGAVYNAGGSRYSNVSMLEAIEQIEKRLGKKGSITYADTNRVGDHIWYISDVSRFKQNYPAWEYTKSLDTILDELCEAGRR